MKGIFAKSSDWETIYPIGSIYMSTNTTSPATFLGGTWEQIKDRFLLCSGSTYSNGATGGSATHLHSTAEHTLTVSEMPKHKHTVTSRMHDDGTDNGSIFNIANWGNPASGGSHYILSIQTVAASLSSGSYVGATNTGGDGSHSHGNTSSSSNLPPYIAVTVWKRTA